jgi:hypothetical protein
LIDISTESNSQRNIHTQLLSIDDFMFSTVQKCTLEKIEGAFRENQRCNKEWTI